MKKKKKENYIKALDIIMDKKKIFNLLNNLTIIKK